MALKSFTVMEIYIYNLFTIEHLAQLKSTVSAAN